jgi:hypothetical protein
MYHTRHIRLFESAIRELAARGHRIHLAFEGMDAHVTAKEGASLARRLCAEHHNVTAGPARRRDDLWAPLATSLRRSIDYLRYLSPPYEHTPKLRRRAKRHVPRAVVWLTRCPGIRSPRGLAALDRVLRQLERAVPRNPAVEEFIRSQRADIVLVTPLVAEPLQADCVRSALALGVRTALCVASWDNLTNKGLVRDIPQRVYVWNQDQVREGVELHGIPPERMVATGAHSYDQWFDRTPATTPEEFREQVGLPADRPIVLYLCSSHFVSHNEPDFVERWIRGLRSHRDPALREASVLIRPHPKSGGRWADSELGRLPGVTVWPPTGETTTSEEAKAGYFDSMHHCAAVVGLNTSGLIESTILGRPVLTVMLPEFEETQEGTLHFRYLLEENGGPLVSARSLDQHLVQLAGVLRDDAASGAHDGFLTRFVRPHGLDQPATPILADVIEEQLRTPAPEAVASRTHQVVLAGALRPLAVVSARASASRLNPGRRMALQRKRLTGRYRHGVRQLRRRVQRTRTAVLRRSRYASRALRRARKAVWRRGAALAGRFRRAKAPPDSACAASDGKAGGRPDVVREAAADAPRRERAGT